MGELHDAAGAGDVARIRELIAAGADANEIDDYGMTPIHLAAHEAQAGAVRVLLEVGASVHPLSAGCAPLMPWAAEDGSPEVVEMLLNAGADPNGKFPDGWTGLHEAACLGRVEIAALLLQAEAEPNVETGSGMTPLLLAAEGAGWPGYAEVARLLVAHGADVTVADPEGRTAVELAVRSRNQELVAFLVANGAHHSIWSAAAVGDVEALEALLSAGADANATDTYESTALHRAVEHPGAVRVLLRHGADPLKGDVGGDVPVHCWARSAGKPEAAQALVEAGTDVDMRNPLGQTPLRCAAEEGNVSAVQVLLDLGADPSIPDNHGVTPLEAAREGGHEEVASLLSGEGRT